MGNPARHGTTPNPAADQQQPPANANNPNDGLDDADRAVLANIPVNGSVEKKVVLDQVNELTGIGDRRLRDSIKKLIAVPLQMIGEFKVDRPGKVDAVYLRRVQPPQQPAVEAQPQQQPPPPPCQTCQPPE